MNRKLCRDARTKIVPDFYLGMRSFFCQIFQKIFSKNLDFWSENLKKEVFPKVPLRSIPDALKIWSISDSP